MKKNSLSVLIVIVSLLTFNLSVAQKAFTEGRIVYEISFPADDLDPQMKAMMPTESVVYVKGAMSRTELSMAMGMSSASIMNSKTGEVTALTDFMGNKTYMNVSADKNSKSSDKPAIENLSETKKIAGYDCKKAKIKLKDGSEMMVFYTDKISTRLSGVPGGKDLGGFPMQYSVNQMGMKMTFTAKSVTAEKVSDDLFKVPAGYKFVTPEDLQKMYGGGQ
jgi:GLPGLI family protein